MIERPRISYGAGMIVADLKTGAIALVKNRDNGHWSFPKGMIEETENPLTAAKREVREEVGDHLTFKTMLPIGTYARPPLRSDMIPDTTRMKIISMFYAKALITKRKKWSQDVSDVQWVQPEKVAAQLSHPADRQFYLERACGIVNRYKKRN